MKLWGFFRRHGWRYLPGLLFLLANAYLDVLPPKLLGQAVDLLRGSAIDKQAVIVRLWQMALAAAGIFTTRAIWRSFINGNARRMEMYLRRQLFTHLQSLPTSFYNRQKTGDLMAYAINDVNAIRMAFGPGLALAAMSIFTGTFSIARMGGGVDVRLATFALLPVPVVLAAVLYLGRESRMRFRRVQEAFAQVSDRVQENISGIRVIKAYAQEEKEIERFEPLNRRMLDTNVNLVKISSAVSPMVALAFGISFTISLVYGSALVRGGEITLGDFVAFNGYLSLVVFPVQAVARVTNILQRGLASLKRYSAILDVKTDIENPGKNLHEGPLKGGIDIRGLTFRYPEGGMDALSDIRLSVRPGGTLGILGHTGSGKTTLANLLLRLYNPPRGTVFYDGVDILDIELDTLREGIGYVMQDGFLFSATVYENIAFYAPGATREDVEEAAKKAGVYENIMEFPQGFDTVVGERGVTLSGGQKQRIAIARALLRKPGILILDDSLSAVDAHTERVIWQALKEELSSGMSGVVIAHRVSALMDCDEIIVLHEGRIEERGTHAQLMALGGHYAQIAQAQFSGEEGVHEEA